MTGQTTARGAGGAEMEYVTGYMAWGGYAETSDGVISCQPATQYQIVKNSLAVLNYDGPVGSEPDTVRILGKYGGISGFYFVEVLGDFTLA